MEIFFFSYEYVHLNSEGAFGLGVLRKGKGKTINETILCCLFHYFNETLYLFFLLGYPQSPLSWLPNPPKGFESPYRSWLPLSLSSCVLFCSLQQLIPLTTWSDNYCPTTADIGPLSRLLTTAPTPTTPEAGEFCSCALRFYFFLKKIAISQSMLLLRVSRIWILVQILCASWTFEIPMCTILPHRN